MSFDFEVFAKAVVSHFAKGGTEKEQAEALLEMARYWEPRLRKAFEDAVQNLRDKVNLKAVADDLAAGRIQQALDVLTAQTISYGYAPIATAITEAVTAGANAAAAFAADTSVPGVGRIAIRFNILNPATSAFLRQHTFNAVQALTAQTREVVKQVVTTGVETGQNPYTTAVRLKNALGLTPRQEQAVNNYRKQLLAGDSGGALDRALRDKRFDRTVQRISTHTVELKDGTKVVKPGVPLKAAQVDKMVDAYRRKWIAYRAATIARTESIRAVNIGNHQLWQQQIDEGLVKPEQLRRKWVYTDDGKVRHAHRTIPRRNKAGVGFNQPFDSELGPIMYPGDPEAKAENTINCRCTQIIRLVATF